MSLEKTSFVYVTYIRSTPDKVFEAITRPEIARRYWGHENVSDWQPGSKWEHVRANDQRNVNVSGLIGANDVEAIFGFFERLVHRRPHCSRR